MDAVIAEAARALASGDALGALNRVALREDGAGLAVRGIALARLGDLARGRALLLRAARVFGDGPFGDGPPGDREAVARARCVVAEAEIALAQRDLDGRGPDGAAAELEAAGATLERHGDRANAAHARTLQARWLLLLGRLDGAERAAAAADATALPPALRAVHELVSVELAMRRIRAIPAQQALARARRAAAAAGIAALTREVEGVATALAAPAARCVARGEERVLGLAAVEALLASPSLIVDACRRVVRENGRAVDLGGRPVLFALARALAEAWPGDAAREALLSRVFRARHADESHRARLRVEIGRLRACLRPFGTVRATSAGFVLVPRSAGAVVVLAPPVDDANAAVLALLADGEAWSSSALAMALGSGQRTVQRALEALAAAGRVRAVGQGRARRWAAAPVACFATPLLLPGALPGV